MTDEINIGRHHSNASISWTSQPAPSSWLFVAVVLFFHTEEGGEQNGTRQWFNPASSLCSSSSAATLLTRSSLAFRPHHLFLLQMKKRRGEEVFTVTVLQRRFTCSRCQSEDGGSSAQKRSCALCTFLSVLIKHILNKRACL